MTQVHICDRCAQMVGPPASSHHYTIRIANVTNGNKTTIERDLCGTCVYDIDHALLDMNYHG